MSGSNLTEGVRNTPPVLHREEKKPVLLGLKKLLNGKATGIDDITNRALKDCAELIALSLTGFQFFDQYRNLS